MDLKGKIAIVTGSSRGLGKAIAYRLAENGAEVVLNSSLNSFDMDKTADEFRAKGFNIAVIKGDIGNASDVDSLVKKTIEKFGKIDILINNAGITRDSLLLRMSESDWEEVMNTNLKSVFLCTKAVMKYMLKQKSGKIVNITSVVGVIGNPGQANYSASKAGLIGFTKSVAKEVASRGVTCNAVAPGFIQSKMTDVLPENIREDYLNNIPLKRFGKPEEVAGLVHFLVSDYANYITGQTIHIDGGLVM